MMHCWAVRQRQPEENSFYIGNTTQKKKKTKKKTNSLKTTEPTVVGARSRLLVAGLLWHLLVPTVGGWQVWAPHPWVM